jgi:5'-nucleotidase
MGVQAMTLGNHEWDYGPAVLGNWTQNPSINFPILACNVDASRDPILRSVIKPYTVITTASGIRVGVVGALTPDTPFLSSPGPNITFNSLYPSLQNAVNEVRTMRVDIVVLLSHIGYTVDQEVARNVTGIDLIIGGHSHSFLYSNSSTTPLPELNRANGLTDAANYMGPYPTTTPLAAQPNTTTPITTAFWASRYLGRFDTVFDGPSRKLKSIFGNPILLGQSGSDSNITPDPAAQAIIDQLAPPVRNLGFQVVGATARRLDGDTRLVRSQETNLGNIIADSMVASIARTMFSQAGYGPLWLGLENGGGIRASIQAPGGTYPYNITQNDILTVLPFGNYISVQLVTGQQLIDALENGVSQIESGAGRFPQVAGMRFAFSPNATAGARVIRSTIQVRTGMTGAYELINPAANYPLATNNFIVAAPGGDGYASIAASTSIYQSGAPLDQALGEYIAANTPLNQTTDGRIVDCAVTPSSPLCIGVPGVGK